MAYRRRQGITKASTFKEEIYHPPDQQAPSRNSSFPSSNNSLAAQAIRASAAARRDSSSPFDQPPRQAFNAYEDERNQSRGFWGILAQKAKAIIDDENVSHPSGDDASGDRQQFRQPQVLNEGFMKMDNPKLRKGLDKLTYSLNQIGDTFEKAFEEGRTMVENKKVDILQETRKFQMRRKGMGPEAEFQTSGGNSPWQQSPQHPTLQNQTNHETHLKASRDVALATAAKAKLLLRELKTVKADLAFAKERCAQLEEENRRLREGREKGNNAADDDMIRLQLETLLAEKARLAHENSIYARENRFLREIVEYHQLTMQDVVYIDEGIEEVTEVYPSITRTLSSCSPPSPLSPASASEHMSSGRASDPTEKEIYPVSDQVPPQETRKVTEKEKNAAGGSEDLVPEKDEVRRPSESAA